MLRLLSVLVPSAAVGSHRSRAGALPRPRLLVHGVRQDKRNPCQAPDTLPAPPCPAAEALDRRPALRRHELRPAPIELPMVALAHAEVARPGLQLRVEALVPQAHLRVQGQAP